MRRQFMSGLVLILMMLILAGGASATLSTIGTATYNENEYNLIWDNDNNGNSLVWFDYSNFWAPQTNQVSWASGLSDLLTIDLNAGVSVVWETPQWRLPDTVVGPNRWGTEGDPDGDSLYSYDVGFNIANSEMGHLQYEELAGVASPFMNLDMAGIYYSGTQRVPGSYYWFRFSDGMQNGGNSHGLGLAVRGAIVNINSGGNADVPEPATMLIFGTGLAGLIGIGRKHIRSKC